MPHCIVEHSESLNSELILPLVFLGAMESELFEIDGSDIKLRAIAYHSYLTGPENRFYPCYFENTVGPNS